MKRGAGLRVAARVSIVAVLVGVITILISIVAKSYGMVLIGLLIVCVGAQQARRQYDRADEYELQARRLKRLRDTDATNKGGP